MKDVTLPPRTGSLFVGIFFLLLLIGAVFCDRLKANTQQNDISGRAMVMNYSHQRNSHREISLQLKNASLPDALYKLSRAGEVGISFDYEDIPQKSITYKCNNKAFYAILKDFLKGTNLGFTLSDDRKVVIIQEVDEVQTGSIAGQVTDAQTGETLPGASVFIKGTTKGVATDGEGKYILSGIETGSYILVASFVGYQKQTGEISIIENDTTTVNFELIPKGQALGEMVVTGYQSLSSERSSGAFSSIGEEDIANRPSVDLASAMEGEFTGLRVSGNDFTVRGISTITGAVSDPLIVVDGFAIEGGLSTINPNDVKSIHILKDAAAASIWGARASNGVIVITTKEAHQGVQVDVNVFTDTQEMVDLDKVNPIAGSADALRWERYLWDNSQTFSSFRLSAGVDGNNNPASFGVQLLKMRDDGDISQSEFDQRWSQLQQTNYQDDVYNYLLQNPMTQNYDLTISGGGERNDFVLNTRYVDQQEGFRYNDSHQLLANFRNNYQITPWLDTRISVMTRFTRSDNSGASLGDISNMSPYETLVDENGDYTTMVGSHYQEFIDSTGVYFPEDWNYNLLQEVRNRDLKSQKNDIRIQAGLKFDIFDGLVYQTKFQYEHYKSEYHNYYNEDSYFVRDQRNKWVEYDQVNNQVLKEFVPEGGQLLQGFGTTKGYTFRNQLNYNQQFGDHLITGGLFTEISSKEFENFSPARVYGYDDEKLTSEVPETYFPVSAYWGANNYQLSGLNSNLSYSNDRFLSLLGNAAYTYKDKYSLTGSFRTDASNLIVEESGDRYSPFWSVGANWRVGQEDFLKNIEALNRLNFRLSYGYSGNVVLSTSPVALISFGGTYPLTGAEYGTISNYGNPDLRWERTKIVNFGIDYSLFNDKLSGSIELYNKHGEDIVGSVDLPSVTGTTSESFNTAEIINRGFEFNINSSLPITSKVFWNSTLNFSYNKSEVQSLSVLNYNSSTISSSHFEEGRPAGALYSYTFLGMNEDNVPVLQGVDDNTFTFDDVPPGTIDDREYMEYSGSTQPTTLLGWENSISAFGFRLSAIINGEFGHVFRRPTFDYFVLAGSKGSSTIHEDAISVLNGTEEGIPAMPSGDAFSLEDWRNYVPYLSTTIEDAAHIRLREVNLSYRLPINITSRMGLSQAKVYLQARNLGLLWAANDEGLDPSYIYTGTPPKIYKVGVSFGF